MLTAQVPQRLAPPRRAGAIRAPTISRLARSPAGYWTPPPAALSIPSIAVNARLTRLGITTAGAIEVPTDPAVPGWYTRSPKPGAIGSSIILGHFDSRSGPAVFYHLGRLRPGERILIRRTDGSRTVFRVVLVQAYDKDHFPTAAVYGPTPDAELRLVTCGGVFDQRVRSYLSNVVVYATKVREAATAGPGGFIDAVSGVATAIMKHGPADPGGRATRGTGTANHLVRPVRS